MNRQLILLDVHVFNYVARTRSFTAAAREVGVSRSSISKKISRLEQTLGVTLLNRNTRNVNLTEAGRTFFEHTSEAATAIEQAAEVVKTSDKKPTGTVGLSVSSSLGATILLPLVTRFQLAWPDVKINLNVEHDVVDLISSGNDLAIRMAPKLEDSSLISKRLGTTKMVLAASPGYLKRFGTPARPEDLRDHCCLAYVGCALGGESWRFRRNNEDFEIPTASSIVCNDAQTLIDAACLDNGIIHLPHICICKEISRGRLQTILLDDLAPTRYGIFAIYPHRHVATKVKVLVEFLEQELRSLPSIE